MPQPDDGSLQKSIADADTGRGSETREGVIPPAVELLPIERFKQLWRHGPAPDLMAFTSAAGPLNPETLAAILRCDLLYRWDEGKRLPVEWYFERFESLAQIPELAVDLIYTEYLQGEEHGQRPGADEYYLRFPQHQQILRDQFKFHNAICGHGIDAEQSDGDADRPATVKLQRFPSIPGYDIAQEVGRGGIGVVYRAHDRRLHRTVALKLLLSGDHASPLQLRRFQVEAEAAARLQHRNIVQIHEIGEFEGRPYLALEFVNGGSLADRYRGQLLAPRYSAILIEQIARAIEFAHQNGIIHRDLKPANVLLEESQTEEAVVLKTEATEEPTPARLAHTTSAAPNSTYPIPVPKITDFGLAKFAGAETVAFTDNATQTGDILGTPSYMAPEQAAGRLQDIGVETDVYAIGAILYQLLTGRPPFVGATPMETLRQVTEMDPIPPARWIPSIPPDLQTICLKCLQKEPRKRYRSASQLADDLHRFLADRPISARRTSSIERIWRWTRRNPVIASLIGMVLTMLSIGLPMMTVLYLREQSQAVRAEQHFRLASGAVEQYLTHVGESAELKAHGLEKFRRNLLLTAKEFYEQLGTHRSDDPAFQVEVANAHRRLAFISDELGDLDSSIEQYKRMRDVSTNLVRDYPQDRNYLALHSQSHTLLGHVYQEQGNLTAAEWNLRKAREWLIQSMQGVPMSASDRLDLTVIVLDLVALYGAMDRNGDEQACFQEAQQLCDELRANPPEISADGTQLTRAYNAMAVASVKRGMFREAETYYNAARDLSERLTQQFPDIPEHAADLGSGFANLAAMYVSQGRYDEARQAFAMSNQLVDRLAADHPLILDYQVGAAGNWLNAGSLEFHAGNWEKADAAWQEARRRYTTLKQLNPKIPALSLAYAKTTSNLGNVCYMRQQFPECQVYYTEAMHVVESLVTDQPANTELQGFLAGIQSNLANAYMSVEKLDPAVELFKNAAQTQKGLMAIQPDVLENRRRLAASLINLANVLHKSGKLSEGEGFVREGCDVARKLANEHADVPDYADVLGDSLKLLGNIQFDAHRLEDSEVSYLESLRVREALVESHSNVTPYRVKLSKAQFLLGRVARDTARPAQALEWFDRAISSLEPERKVSMDQPADDTTAIRESLCDIHWEKARSLYRLEQVAEALAECDLGLGFTTGTYAAGLHALRARVLARLSRIEDAMAEAKSISDFAQLSRLDLQDLAAAYALAAEQPGDLQAEYRRRAIEILRNANAKSPPSEMEIPTDPDLADISHLDEVRVPASKEVPN
jgi:serine/threonine protein kinase